MGRDRAAEVAFFDRFTVEHGDYDVFRPAAWQRLVHAFVMAVGPRPGERCIDLGCGSGAFTRRLRGLGLALVGMDLSPRSIEHARALAPDIEFRVGDMTATGLPGGSCDLIVYSGVLHHFATREQRVEALREGHRLLAPGGRLFAYEPNLESPSMWLYRHPRSPLYSSAGKTENEVLLHRREVASDLRALGFSDVRIRGLGGLPFAYVEGRWARRALPLYNVYERLLAGSPLEDRWGTFLIVAATRH